MSRDSACPNLSDAAPNAEDFTSCSLRIRAPAVLAPAALHPAEEDGAAAIGVVHLDLHPFNVLVDDGGRVTAVLDWANAARGPADLDRARTLSILTLDPASRQRREDPRWVALNRGWIDAADLTQVPVADRAWAYRYMLADLAHRYPAAQLTHVHAALAGIEPEIQKGPQAG